MNNLEFITKPVLVKAIQFAHDGSNWDEVIKIVHLNGGNAQLIYVDKDGNPVPNNTITEHKAILLQLGPQMALACTKGTYIILNENEMYPVPEKEFNQFYLKLEDINEISNGMHTFRQLYTRISRYEPTLEQILVSTIMTHDYPVGDPVRKFIEESAYVVTDSENKAYYIINGLIYVFKD